LQQKEEHRVPKSNIVPGPSQVSKVIETIFDKDPFLPPFNSLLVGEMNDDLEEGGIGYYVVLNKYAVVPGHFLLVTKGDLGSIIALIYRVFTQLPSL
jgi:hypothetical protein